MMILSDRLLDALREAGIAPERTRRVVVDMHMGQPPIIYIERYGDQSLLSLVRALDGVKVTWVHTALEDT